MLFVIYLSVFYTDKSIIIFIVKKGTNLPRLSLFCMLPFQATFSPLPSPSPHISITTHRPTFAAAPRGMCLVSFHN